jgi:predicted nucleic acid-binding protein
MSYEYVIDSYAWVEYFRGTDAGKKARKYVEGDAATTSTLTLAELREKYLREGWTSFEEDVAFITTRTSLTPVDRTIALLSGEINHERKKAVRNWGMADSMILATARTASAKVVTGDKHFEGLPEAIMI